MASKRANNEGTLYFREDRKRWCAQLSLEGQRLTKYGKTQKECRDWMKETLSKIRWRTYLRRNAGDARTLRCDLAGWESNLPKAQDGLSYRKIAQDHILPFDGKNATAGDPAGACQATVCPQERRRSRPSNVAIYPLCAPLCNEASSTRRYPGTQSCWMQSSDPKVEQSEV